MTPDINPHLTYQILNAPIREYPFPHFFITNIFPEAFYNQIIENLPHNREYQSLVEQGLVYYQPETEEIYSKRNCIELSTDDIKQIEKKKRTFWQELAAELSREDFINPLILKYKKWLINQFGAGVNIKYKVMIDLLRDSNQWALGPHTDHPDKIAVILFYLATNNKTPYLGTSIYTPKQSNFTCEGGPHHNREVFNRANTLPFLPNSAFGFLKNNVSFHGVESMTKIGDVRNLIQLSVLKTT